MVTVKSVHTYTRTDKKVVSESVITAASGDTISAGDLQLNTIEYIKSIEPITGNHVVTAKSVTNPGSLNNTMTFTAYTLSAGSLTTEAGSVDWTVVAVGE